jgi:hypothetical protein
MLFVGPDFYNVYQNYTISKKGNITVENIDIMHLQNIVACYCFHRYTAHFYLFLDNLYTI